MAAPHVSGLAGLLFAQDPIRSNQEVRSIIEATADDLGGAGFDAIYGYGRINADAAIQYGAPPATGNISGTVTNADDGTAIAGATVLVEDTGQSAITDASGDYSIADVPTGDHMVTASADGFESASQIVTVLESATTTADFALTPETAPPGVTVTVSIGMSTDSRTAGPNTFVRAVATVTIVDEYSDAVEGATVSGHWDGATNDSDSGTTDLNGDVSLKSDSVKNPPSETTFIFVVDRVTKGDVIYELAGETSASITIP